MSNFVALQLLRGSTKNLGTKIVALQLLNGSTKNSGTELVTFMFHVTFQWHQQFLFGIKNRFCNWTSMIYVTLMLLRGSIMNLATKVVAFSFQKTFKWLFSNNLQCHTRKKKYSNHFTTFSSRYKVPERFQKVVHI